MRSNGVVAEKKINSEMCYFNADAATSLSAK